MLIQQQDSMRKSARMWLEVVGCWDIPDWEGHHPTHTLINRKQERQKIEAFLCS